MTDDAKEERASIRRVHNLIDWLCDAPKPRRPTRRPMKPIRITTPREFLENHHELGLFCRACDRWTVADLQQLIDMGRGDREIQRMRFKCKDCGGKMDKQVRPPRPPRT